MRGTPPPPGNAHASSASPRSSVGCQMPSLAPSAVWGIQRAPWRYRARMDAGILRTLDPGRSSRSNSPAAASIAVPQTTARSSSSSASAMTLTTDSLISPSTTAAAEGIEHYIAGIGADMDDALEEPLGFGCRERLHAREESDKFLLCVLRMADLVVKPDRLRNTTTDFTQESLESGNIITIGAPPYPVVVI